MAIKFQPQQEKTYKVGDTFLYKNKEPYMIVVPECNGVILSCLTNGGRWGDVVKVSNYDKISQAEFDQIADGDSSDFTQRDFKLTMI